MVYLEILRSIPDISILERTPTSISSIPAPALTWPSRESIPLSRSSLPLRLPLHLDSPLMLRLSLVIGELKLIISDFFVV